MSSKDKIAQSDSSRQVFLFSVDLEDLRMRAAPGDVSEEDHLPRLVAGIEAFLARRQARATFFVVGALAAKYPDLIARLAANGHEIAWHSHHHRPLTALNRGEFLAELHASRQAFATIGITELVGFRAPYFSLTPATAWVYPLLADHGFLYSSSVLAAKRQRYAWPDFGDRIRKIDGICELPVSVVNAGVTSLPFAGGAYLRCLPLPLLRAWFRRAARRDEPLRSYVHPYDFDAESKWRRFPDAHVGPLINFWLHYNRGQMLPRLEELADLAGPVKTYRDFVAAWR